MGNAADAHIGFRAPQWFKDELLEDAAKSGWTLSEQILYELLERRGKWQPKQPYLPGHSGSSSDRSKRRSPAA